MLMGFGRTIESKIGVTLVCHSGLKNQRSGKLFNFEANQKHINLMSILIHVVMAPWVYRFFCETGRSTLTVYAVPLFFVYQAISLREGNNERIQLKYYKKRKNANWGAKRVSPNCAVCPITVQAL